jgi:anti-sigma regulatory factor (Ser/Thr protein kinase)/N-acetylglutamate synthase-like GNAT family acetyltransferase
MLGRATLTLPASPSALVLADTVAAGFAHEAGIAADDVARIQQAVRCLVAFSVEQSYEGRGKGDVELSLELDPAGVQVVVHDWGRPFRVAGGAHGPLPEGLEAAAAIDPEARVINLADQGKRLVLRVPVEHGIAIAPVVDGAADEERARSGAVEDIVIRDATTDDAVAIAQLLYRGYGLGYVHSEFYRPIWIEEAMRDGHVSSTVACVGDEIIGHHALLCSAPGEAAESGVAVIAHEWRGLGLFDRMFDVTVARARRIGLPALFGQATTAHIYSQRSEFKSGYKPSALLIGAAPAVMAQAQADSGATPAGRGALLNSVMPLVEQPTINGAAPERYAKVIKRLATEAGYTITSARGAEPLELTEQLEYSTAGDVAFIYLSGELDASRVERMLWSEEARQAGTLYADIDLSCPNAAALDALRHEGFFLAGLIASGRGGRDWLRLQRPQDTADMDAIHLEGETANWLLEQVLADRDSVS